MAWASPVMHIVCVCLCNISDLAHRWGCFASSYSGPVHQRHQDKDKLPQQSPIARPMANKFKTIVNGWPWEASQSEYVNNVRGPCEGTIRVRLQAAVMFGPASQMINIV